MKTLEELKKETNKNICFVTNTNKTIFAVLKLVSIDCKQILVDPKIPNEKGLLESYDYGTLLTIDILHKKEPKDEIIST